MANVTFDVVSPLISVPDVTSPSSLTVASLNWWIERCFVPSCSREISEGAVEGFLDPRRRTRLRGHDRDHDKRQSDQYHRTPEHADSPFIGSLTCLGVARGTVNG